MIMDANQQCLSINAITINKLLTSTYSHPFRFSKPYKIFLNQTKRACFDGAKYELICYHNIMMKEYYHITDTILLTQPTT